jgi:prepilin-type N-terminal cleavage/methylation domain-containing protein
MQLRDFYTSHRERIAAKAFTLIELLVVIAILAILMVIVIITLNPAQLIQQSRDSNRLTDLANMQTAINLFLADQPGASIGSASTTYISIPDPTATTTAGTNCAGLGISVPANWTYHCPSPNNVRATNGQGWLPINLASISEGNPLPQLPIDPTNTTSSGLYYTYTPSGSTYAITATMESSKYFATAQNDTGVDPTRYEIGSKPALAAQAEGLMGLWKLDEGSGSSSVDSSGNGYTGTWSGTPTGTSGYYSAGKVGTWSGTFDGSTDYISAGNMGVFPTQGTIAFWMNASSLTSYPNPLTTNYAGGNAGIRFEQSGGTFQAVIGNDAGAYSGGGIGCTSAGISANTWYHIVYTWNTATNLENCYQNGSVVNASVSNTFWPTTIPNFTIGEGFNTSRYWSGKIDDVRIYNRALSANEVQALYNAEK